MALVKTKLKSKAKKIKAAVVDAEIENIPEPQVEEVDPFVRFYVNQLDGLEKEYRLTSNSLVIPDRLSTGMLVTDLISNGGLGAGAMFSFAGPEASAKSTLAMTVLGSAVKNKLFTNYHDPEGSMDAAYASQILRIDDLDKIFGRTDDKGNWVVMPKARYYDDNTLETFFDFERDFLMKLPDKIYRKEDDTWYYAFNQTRDGIRDRIKEMGLKIDTALSKDTNKLYCPTDRRGAQAVIFCDSWPSLLSQDQDVEGKERSKALAFNARKFSEYLPQVVGKLRRKAVILPGVNQIRLNPGAYGNPMYEPGGQALKFYSSGRYQLFAKTVPHDVKKPVENEPSAFGDGEDVYAYKYIKNTKNKQGTPFLDGWLRVWVRDREGQGRGFCPVWDNYQYLLRTGRILGKRNKFQITFPGFNPTKKVLWHDFKKYCLAETKEQKSQAIKLMGITKWIDLRAACFAEIKSGKGMILFNENAANKSKIGTKEVEDLEE